MIFPQRWVKFCTYYSKRLRPLRPEITLFMGGFLWFYLPILAALELGIHQFYCNVCKQRSIRNTWKKKQFSSCILNGYGLGFGLFFTSHVKIDIFVFLLDLFWLINLNRKRGGPLVTATVIIFDWSLWCARLRLRRNHESLIKTDLEVRKQIQMNSAYIPSLLIRLCITFCVALYKFSFGLITVVTSFFSSRISHRVSEKTSSLFMRIMSLFAVVSNIKSISENEK